MSVVDPDYLKAVEDHFVALRGKGYALSGRDVGRVLTWQSDGVPLAVVLRALDEEARKRGPSLGRDPRPLTLGSFARTVRDQAEAYAERHVQAQPAPVEPAEVRRRAQHERLCGVIEASLAEADGPVAGLLVSALDALAGHAASDSDPWTAAAEVDALIASRLASLLGAAEREALEAQVALRLDPRASPQARAEQHDAELAAALRARAGVPHLVQVMLDGQ